MQRQNLAEFRTQKSENDNKGKNEAQRHYHDTDGAGCSVSAYRQAHANV